MQLLGEITAFRDGRPVPLSAPHRRLLAFLALHPGPHERDTLAARFWPDSPDPRANLRTAVWVLRRSLGDDAVVATRTSVALGPVTRDLDEIDALEPTAASRARGSTTTGPSAHAPSTFAGGSRGSTTSRVRPATRPTPRAGRRAAAP